MDGYFLHVGPSLLPRQPRRETMSLAEALHRAYGLRYAVVYRLGVEDRPVPVVADAGNPNEVIFLPSGRRVGREAIIRHGELGEAEDGSLPGTEETVVGLARQQDVEPIRSTDELVQPGMFDSDEELEEFLSKLRRSRRRGA